MLITSSFWAWLILIGVWSFCFATLDLWLFGDGDNLTWFGIFFGVICLGCLGVGLLAGVTFGSIEWLRYMEAWPFIPQ